MERKTRFGASSPMAECQAPSREAEANLLRGQGPSPQATPEKQDKKPIRSMTEYIRSPHQMAAAKLRGQNQTKEQKSAKNFFRKAEAQGLADIFRGRVERALEGDMDSWTVEDYQGDLIRKAIIKVRTGEDEYVHLFAMRLMRGEPWRCLYAPYKGDADPLEQAEEEYEVLPERSHCGEKLDLHGCSTSLEGCSVM